MSQAEGGRPARKGAPSAPPRDLTHGVLVFGDPGTGKTVILQEIVSRNLRDGCPFVAWDYQGYWLPRPGLTLARVATAEEAAKVAIQVANREGGATLVVDEASLAWPHDNPPRPGSALHHVTLIGRNPQAFGPWRCRGPVSYVAGAQYPRSCATMLRNSANRYYLGRVQGDSDLAWIREATKDDDLVRRVRDLPKRRFLVHDRE